MHQPRNRALPKSIGGNRRSPLGLLIMLVGFALTLWLCTEYIAWRLHWSPWLGRPLAAHIYAPTALLGWVWTVTQPLQQVHYTPLVYATFGQIGYGLPIGIALSVVAATIFDALQSSGRADHLLDSAHFATPKEIRTSRLLKAKAGPILGAYDMPRQGAVPLRYDGELGISYTDSPGGGKTSGFLKTNLLIPLRHAEAPSWKPKDRRAHPWGEEPSIVALDIRGDLFAGTSGYQERLGKHVLRLEPLAVTEGTARYNPLWTVRLGTLHEYDDCYAKMLSIVDMHGKGLQSYWDRAALSFGAACIGKLGYIALNAGKPELFSLPGLVDYVTSKGTIDELVMDILEVNDDPHEFFQWEDEQRNNVHIRPWIASAARAMHAKAPEEKSGVYGSLVEFLSLYRSEVLRHNISSSTFSFHGIANGEKAVALYITVPPTRLESLRPYLRMLIEDALRELTFEGGLQEGRSVRPHVRSVVFALDEIASLRYLDQIENASGFLRGYGVMLWLLWQSVAQQRKYYSENELLTETMDVLLFGRPRSLDGAEAISELLGEQSVAITKHAHSGGRYSVALTHEQEQTEVISRPVLTPYEVRGIDQDRMFGFVDGLSIYLRKFHYWRNPLLQSRSTLAPSTRSPGLIARAPFLAAVESVIGAENLERIATKKAPSTEQKPAEVAV